MRVLHESAWNVCYLQLNIGILINCHTDLYHYFVQLCCDCDRVCTYSNKKYNYAKEAKGFNDRRVSVQKSECTERWS